jgi:hypothetical protein
VPTGSRGPFPREQEFIELWPGRCFWECSW